MTGVSHLEFNLTHHARLDLEVCGQRDEKVDCCPDISDVDENSRQTG
jgi:hypothetical protein